MVEWRNGGMAGMAEQRKEWPNSRMAEMATYVLFMVHTDDTDDDDDAISPSALSTRSPMTLPAISPLAADLPDPPPP